MSEQGTLSDKPCGATADWILGYLANECSLDMGCVSPADFLAVVNAIHNHELDLIEKCAKRAEQASLPAYGTHARHTGREEARKKIAASIRNLAQTDD